MSDALAIPAEAEPMPAIESAVLAKVFAVGVAGFGFAGFAMTWDPIGVATGIAGGITIVSMACLKIKESYDKSNAGKTRAALKAERAENVRLRAEKADQAKLIDQLWIEVHRRGGQLESWVDWRLVKHPETGPPRAADAAGEQPEANP